MQADDLPFALGVGGHGDYRRDRDDAAALALFEVGGVQPEVGPLAAERAIEERPDPVVDVLAQLADGALADPGPIACTRSSTRRVETPPTQASWITATRAFSEVLRGSRKGGK